MFRAPKAEEMEEQRPRAPDPEAGAGIAPHEMESRRAMRDREISGRAYRLCFDGGWTWWWRMAPASSRNRHPDRRTGKTWMLYHPKSCPELMEYAGLLIVAWRVGYFRQVAAHPRGDPDRR